MCSARAISIISSCGLLICAFLSGTLAYFSFAPHSYHWSMVAAISVFEILILFYLRRESPKFHMGRTLGFGFLSGFFWGLGLYLPLFVWISEFVEILPWIALSILIALFNAVIGLFVVLIGLSDRGRPHSFFIFAVPIVWSAVEALRLHFPFGGFPWGSPAFSQTTSIIGSASLWGSTTAVTFLTVLCSTVLAEVFWLVVALRQEHSTKTVRKQLSAFVSGTLVILVTISSSWIYETYTDRFTKHGHVLHVAYIQGDVVAEGIDFNSIRMQVLQNHVLATHRLAHAVRQGQMPQPDVVVWPENSADVDPFRDHRASKLITEAAQAIDAPILVGTVLNTHSDSSQLNAVLLWSKAGYKGQRHIKRHIQPFGEYLPWRPLVEKLSPYAAWAGHFTAGNDSGLIKVAGTKVGIATCYEVIFNDSLHHAVNAGAQWLAVPTNNATFGRTHQTYQQLEMARFRSRELHRWIVSSATSGVSAFLTPTGDVIDATGLYTQAFSVRSIPLFDERTIASVISKYVDLCMWVLTVVVFCSCIARVLMQRRRRL